MIQDGNSGTCDEAEDLENNEPEDFVDISVEPQPVEEGETLEAEVTVDGEVEGEMVYEWQESHLSGDVPDETSSGEISFQANEEAAPRGESALAVNIFHEEYGVLGNDEEEIEWDIYRPDVEEYDVEYGEGEVQIKISEDYRDTIRDLRFGESIEAWSQATIMHRNIRAGGVNLEIEEPSDYDAPEDLEVYSAVEISGQNIEGIEFEPRAQVSKEWLENNDLLIGDRNAKLNYYKIEDGEWTELGSRVYTHDQDGEMVLDSRPSRSDEDEEKYMLEGSTKMAIAGSPEGELDRTFAVSSDGECDRFEDDEPIPPGWEEIDTTCEIHTDSEQIKEDIERFKENMKQQANRTDTFAVPEDFDEKLSDIKETASDYEIEEARTELEEYQEEVGHVRRVSRRGENVEEQFSHIKETFAGLSEQQLNSYNQSEEALELRDEIEQHIENDETVKAYEKMRTLEETHIEALERISQKQRLKDQIERLRNTQDLQENHTELLNEAEQDLENGEIRVAQEKVSRVVQEYERQIFRQMIREIVVDVLNDVLPFDI